MNNSISVDQCRQAMKPMIIFFTISVYCGLMCSPLTAQGEEPTVVFTDDFCDVDKTGMPKGWSFWIPNAKMELAVQANADSIGGRKAFRVTGNGNQHAKGTLRHSVTDLETGQYYKFEVVFAVDGIVNIHDTVKPVVRLRGKSFQHLIPRSVDGAVVRADLVMLIPENVDGQVTLELFAGWIPRGQVDWLKVTVSHLPGYAPETNPVKVAVIDSKPPLNSTLLENADFYVLEIEKAVQKFQPDVIALGEHFSMSNVAEPRAVPMDSEYITRLKQAARKHHVNLIGSVLEDDDGIHFNTAVLIDRSGKLLGKYRKSHITTGEALLTETSRGDELKVFDTDFGKVGMLVCWDYHFPEAVRTMIMKGAEIIFVPLAGDARHSENGISMGIEYSGKAIALDNRVPIVFAVTNGGTKCSSVVINQQAKVIARSNSDEHIIAGIVDTKERVYQWTGADFRSVYRVDRRPELYTPLVNPSLDSVLTSP